MPERSASIKLVIVGRDGTLNERRNGYVKSAAEWEPIPGALEALARLHQAGWHVVVATNQSGLGRGQFDMSALNEMHLKMNALLARCGGRVDAVFFCPHGAEEGCTCRKPLPGMLLQITERYGVDPAGVPMIGSSPSDMRAAVAAGGLPHLVRTGHAAALDDAGIARMAEQVPGLTVHASLADCVEALLSADRRKVHDARHEGRRSSDA